MTTQLAEKSWVVDLRSTTADTLELSVYDHIGESLFSPGVTAKDMLGKLRAAPATKHINLRINSGGGVVDDAKAMINLLADRKSHGVRVEAVVDGMAASSASYLTTVADKVTMPSNAFLMFHQARGGRMGNADEFAVAADFLRRTNEQLAEAYAAASARRGKSKTKADYLAEMAKGDRYLDADEAIEWGLADEKTEPLKAVAHLADMSELQGAPQALLCAPYVAGNAQEKPLVPIIVNVTASTTSAEAIAAAVKTELGRVLEQQQQISATPVLPTVASKGPLNMSDEKKPEAAPVSEPTVVAVSGVKLLGVANEAEAEAKIKELQITNLQITGATGKPTIAEAMAVILDWKTRADNESRLVNKVATLTEESRVAKRDESIERMSREGTLPPARHDWARTQFATAEAVETFCAGMPKGFFANISEPASAVDSLKLDASERKICASLGMTEEDYLEQKKLEARKVG